MLVIVLCSTDLYSQKQNAEPSLSDEDTLQQSNSRISIYTDRKFNAASMEAVEMEIGKQRPNHRR
jgi:hypothetical protein